MKLKNKTFSEVIISLTLLFVYFRSIFGIVFGDKSIYFLFVIAFIELFLWGILLIQKKRILTSNIVLQLLPWLVFVMYCLLNTQHEVKNGVTNTTFSLIISVLYCLVISTSDNRLGRCCLDVTKFCCKIHCSATIFCALFPKIYKQFWLPLYSSAIQNVLYEQVESGCVPGVTQHYSTNGIYLSFGVIAFAAQFFGLECRNKCDRIWFLLMLFALLLSGKRGHLVFAILSAMIIYYVSSKEKIENKIFKGTFVLTGALTVLILLSNVFPFISTTFNRFSDMFSASDITNGRVYFYDYAISWFKESPLFGIGWEGFKYRLNLIKGSYLGTFEYMNCHNVYLQVFCELGIVGGLLFILKLFTDGWRFIKKINWKNISNNSVKSAMLFGIGMFVFFVMYCMTGNPLYDLETIVPFFCSIGVLYKNSTYFSKRIINVKNYEVNKYDRNYYISRYNKLWCDASNICITKSNWQTWYKNRGN